MKTILITGASSGIGKAIALLVSTNETHLVLWGRSEHRLSDVAAACSSRGASVQTRSLDLADMVSLQTGVEELNAMGAFDEVYLAAGMSDIIQEGEIVEDQSASTNVSMTNYVAPLLLANTLAPKMAAAKRGRFTIIGSHAGFSAIPYSPVYSSSKAGVSLYARSLDQRLRPLGVTVTLVSAGFVDTPMSRRLDCPKPFMLTADSAAAKAVDAARAGKPHLILSWPLYAVTRLSNYLPANLQRRIYDRVSVAQGPRVV